MQRVSKECLGKREKAMIQKLGCLAAILSVFFPMACSKPEIGNARIVFTTIVPLKDFIQQIAGGRYEVHALVGSGQNPHNYTPAPDQMAKLSEASAYFKIGLEVEDGVLPKIKKGMPNVQVVDLRGKITLSDMTEEHYHDTAEYSDYHDHKEYNAHEDHYDAGHDNHHHENHRHYGNDSHVWLSPPRVKIIARLIKNALVNIDPDGKSEYEENMLVFQRRIDSLDAYIRTTLEPVKGTELFVFHPAFGFFADEYGLIEKPVETGGKEPSARDLAMLIEEAREHTPKVIFVQPQYAAKSAETLAAQIGCAVVPINPLPEDYFKEMKEMCTRIHTGLSGNE